MSSNEEVMYVIKRSGALEELSLDKIVARINILREKAGNLKVNTSQIVLKISNQICDKIRTSDIDDMTASQCASMSTIHPDYGKLAAYICISNHQKRTSNKFSEVISALWSNRNINGEAAPLISEVIYNAVTSNAELYDAICDYERDYLFDFFGFKTLERAYLQRVYGGGIVERPQHMWLRVAIGIHGPAALERVRETYDYMSRLYFTHATPTLFNAGMPRSQLSSCYVLAMREDSIKGIYDTLKDVAVISQHAGGIGLEIHDVRATGSYISGTNGVSNGIVPMLRNYDMTAYYVDQGGGKRKGSVAVYLEPWHADIEAFLDLKKTRGDELLRARHLFYALWVPDLFMKRVEQDAHWTLMCPHECPGLSKVYGEEFEKLYCKYEMEKRGRVTMKARDLWNKITDSQIETSMPYMLYKDACNEKSNQKNIGVIRSSNLCTEITLVTSPKETAVCNLASISLPAFIRNDGQFDFDELGHVVEIITENLNRVIDVNYYPTPESEYSNRRHRPIGIGVQGLADVFMQMNLAFTSEAAADLNRRIFETMYYHALRKSCELARIEGAYETFDGSPAQKGILQFDMWGKSPDTDRYDWNRLRDDICKWGLRNSMLLAPMPTASTSQILGNTECFEPMTSNIFARATLAGTFMVVNKYLMLELMSIGLWSKEIEAEIIAADGSIQNIEKIPLNIKEKYKTAWEIPSKIIIDMAADRGKYICQSQSLNLYKEEPTRSMLDKMHFYSWKRGLKTGMYYLRRRANHQAQKFTIEPTLVSATTTEEECEFCSA